MKQGKDEKLFLEVLSYLANGIELDKKYKNYKLMNDKTFVNCMECHIQIYLISDYNIIAYFFK